MKVVVAEKVYAVRVCQELFKPPRRPRRVIGMIVPLVEVVEDEYHTVAVFAGDGGFNLSQIGRLVNIANREYFFHTRMS